MFTSCTQIIQENNGTRRHWNLPTLCVDQQNASHLAAQSQRTRCHPPNCTPKIATQWVGGQTTALCARHPVGQAPMVEVAERALVVAVVNLVPRKGKSRATLSHTSAPRLVRNNRYNRNLALEHVCGKLCTHMRLRSEKLSTLCQVPGNI